MKFLSRYTFPQTVLQASSTIFKVAFCWTEIIKWSPDIKYWSLDCNICMKGLIYSRWLPFFRNQIICGCTRHLKTGVLPRQSERKRRIMNRTERKYYFMQTFLSIKLLKGHRHGLAHARIGDFQHLKLPKVFFFSP